MKQQDGSLGKKLHKLVLLLLLHKVVQSLILLTGIRNIIPEFIKLLPEVVELLSE